MLSTVYPSAVPPYQYTPIRRAFPHPPRKPCLDSSWLAELVLLSVFRSHLQGENSEETSETSTTNANGDGIGSASRRRGSARAGTSLTSRSTSARCACIGVSMNRLLSLQTHERTSGSGVGRATVRARSSGRSSSCASTGDQGTSLGRGE